MGSIVDGIYYPEGKTVVKKVNPTIESIRADNKLDRVYEDHAHELIQPNNPDGTVNEDFITYYPEDAKNYGFIKDEEGEN